MKLINPPSRTIGGAVFSHNPVLPTLPVIVAWIASTATARMKLINPPSRSIGGAVFSHNSVLPERTKFMVNFEPGAPGETSSVTLWQINTTKNAQGVYDILGDFEYIVQGLASNMSDVPWTVVTSKDLSISNVFQMGLFHEGFGNPDDTSVYLNITPSSSCDPGPGSPSSVSSAPGFSTPAPNSTTWASQPIPPETDFCNADRLSGDAGIGIGVAIGVCATIGIAAVAWLLRRHSRKKLDEQAGHRQSLSNLPADPKYMNVANTAHTSRTSPWQGQAWLSGHERPDYELAATLRTPITPRPAEVD